MTASAALSPAVAGALERPSDDLVGTAVGPHGIDRYTDLAPLAGDGSRRAKPGFADA